MLKALSVELEKGSTPKVADVKTMIAEAKAIEAATPDMPPAKKAAAVTAAVATKKEAVSLKDQKKANKQANAAQAAASAAAAQALTEGADQAFAYLQKNLSKAKLKEFAELYVKASSGTFCLLLEGFLYPDEAAA